LAPVLRIFLVGFVLLVATVLAHSFPPAQSVIARPPGEARDRERARRRAPVAPTSINVTAARRVNVPPEGPVGTGVASATSKRRQAMAEQRQPGRQGFASMDEDKQRDIASKGGHATPDEKRSFSQDRELASEAGRKGGESVPDEKRSFSQDRELASDAGRKGGRS
jgi:general stress protein YciG